MEDNLFSYDKKKFSEWVNSEYYQKKLEERLKINDSCLRSRESQILTYQLCRDDPIFFIENFGWTFDPRPQHEPHYLPFILFEYQKDIINWLVKRIKEGEDGYLEKSRDMGVTWLVVWVFYWMWRFGDSFSGLLGSYKEALVDNRTKDSLFGMLDFCVENTPKWLTPARFKYKEHRQKLKLVNPEKINLISGDTMNPNFSRGSRKNVVVFDEAASWQYFRESWECFSDDTETLTNNGWKFIQNVSLDDKVYSMNPMTSEAFWMPVLAKHSRYYDNLIHFQGKSIDLAVSEDHNMLMASTTKPTSQLHFEKAGKIRRMKNGYIPLTSSFVGGDEYDKIYGFDAKDWFEFLGWYISEGHTSKSGTICITQLPTSKSFGKIHDLLRKMKVSYSFPSDKTFYLSTTSFSKEAREELKNLGKCYEKFIPKKYLNASPNLLEILLNSLISGDGYITKRDDRKDVIGYTTSSSKLAGDIQELIQKVGLRATIREIPKEKANGKIGEREILAKRNLYQIRICFKNRVILDKLKNEIIPYKKNAYCLTTPLHTLYVRRNGKAVWTGNSAGDATPCRLAISTPKGRNAAALLRESGIDVMTVHWKLHPLKDNTWYNFQKERRTDEEIAQELDISYHKSQTGRVYPEWDDIEYGDYPYDDSLPLYVSWDFGKSDSTAIVWWQTPLTDKIRIIDAYANHGKTIDFYVPFITGVTPSDDYKYTKKDFTVIEEHKNWRRGIHFGDPAGRFTNQVVNKSVMDVLRQYNINVNFREEAKDFPTRRTETKLLLKNVVVNDNERTKELGLAMENAHYPQTVRGGMEDVRSIKPIHDWTADYRSSVEYFAVNYAKIRNRRSRVVDKFNFEERKDRTIAY